VFRGTRRCGPGAAGCRGTKCWRAACWSDERALPPSVRRNSGELRRTTRSWKQRSPPIESVLMAELRGLLFVGSRSPASSASRRDRRLRCSSAGGRGPLRCRPGHVERARKNGPAFAGPFDFRSNRLPLGLFLLLYCGAAAGAGSTSFISGAAAGAGAGAGAGEGAGAGADLPQATRTATAIEAGSSDFFREQDLSCQL